MFNSIKYYIKTKIPLVIILCSSSICSMSQEMDSATFVENFFKNNGGFQTWKNLKTVKINSEFYEYKNQVLKKKSFNTLHLKLPRKSHYYTFDEGSTYGYTLCLNDSVFWTKSDLGITQIRSKDEFIYFQNTSGLGYPILMLKEGVVTSFNGTEYFQNQLFYKLKIKGNQWLHSVIIYIDMTSYLVRYSKVEGKEKYTIYSDYRNISGLIFPFSEQVFEINNTNMLSEYLTTEVIINSKVSDDLFQPNFEY